MGHYVMYGIYRSYVDTSAKKKKKNDQVSCIYLKYSMMFPLCVLGAIVVSSMLVKAFFVGLPSSSTFFFFSLFFFFLFLFPPPLLSEHMQTTFMQRSRVRAPQ